MMSVEIQQRILKISEPVTSLKVPQANFPTSNQTFEI
jgi:hypothetical protein